MNATDLSGNRHADIDRRQVIQMIHAVKDSDNIMAAEALGPTISRNTMYLLLCLPVSMFVWVHISMYVVVYLLAWSFVA